MNNGKGKRGGTTNGKNCNTERTDGRTEPTFPSSSLRTCCRRRRPRPCDLSRDVPLLRHRCRRRRFHGQKRTELVSSEQPEKPVRRREEEQEVGGGGGGGRGGGRGRRRRQRFRPCETNASERVPTAAAAASTKVAHRHRGIPTSHVGEGRRSTAASLSVAHSPPRRSHSPLTLDSPPPPIFRSSSSHFASSASLPRSFVQGSFRGSCRYLNVNHFQFYLYLCAAEC